MKNTYKQAAAVGICKSCKMGELMSVAPCGVADRVEKIVIQFDLLEQIDSTLNHMNILSVLIKKS